MTHCDFEEVLSKLLSFSYDVLKENDRRKIIGFAALTIGNGGAVFVREATGAARATVTKAIKETVAANPPQLDLPKLDEEIVCGEESVSVDEPESEISENDSTPEVPDPSMDQEEPVMHKAPGSSKEPKPEETDPDSEEQRRRKLQTGKKKADKDRIRKQGGGRKPSIKKYPDLPDRVEEIIAKSGAEFGNPEKELKYTTLSLKKITQALKDNEERPICVSCGVVSRMLDYLGYSKQLNQKLLQVGEPHPDRNAQFEFINQKAIDFLKSGDPVISIDAKKKEKLGNFKNNGAEYRPSGDPRKVLDHDFEIAALGHIIPYGIYLINNNTGFINLGVDHDTAEFAATSVKVWLKHIGFPTFPDSRRIYITCDGGGSNSSRSWLWKLALQEIANETKLEIHVSHYPPGTSKWNKIEHRLFCLISKNWAGQPLEDVETAVNLISSTTTEKGKKVQCVLDTAEYPTGEKATQEQEEDVNIEYIPVGNGTTKWNYIIRPKQNGLF